MTDKELIIAWLGRQELLEAESHRPTIRRLMRGIAAEAYLFDEHGRLIRS